MSKARKTATTANALDPIFQIIGKPTFPGRDIQIFDVARDIIKSMEVNESQTRLKINGEYSVSLSGTMDKTAEAIHFDETTAVEIMGQKAQEADKLADIKIKEAEEILKQAKQDKELTYQNVILAKAYQEKGSLDFDKEGRLVELKIK